MRTDQVPGLRCYNHQPHAFSSCIALQTPKALVPLVFDWCVRCLHGSHVSSHFAASTFFIRPGLQFPFKLQRISSSCYTAGCLLFLQGRTLASRVPRMALMCISLEQQGPERQSFHLSLSDKRSLDCESLKIFGGFITVSKHQKYLFPDLCNTR